MQKEANISDAVAHSFNSIYLSWEQTEVLVNMIAEEIQNNIDEGMANVINDVIPPLC